MENGRQAVGSLSWGQLDQQAQAYAARLRQVGAPGDRVLLLFPAGLDFIGAFMGCLYARMIAVPVPPPEGAHLKRTLPRLLTIIKDAQAKVLIATEQIQCLMETNRTQLDECRNLTWLTPQQVQASAESWELEAIEPEETALIQYTSGSTSSPKGVVISHGNLYHNTRLIEQVSASISHKVAVTWMPHIHDFGLIVGLLHPLYQAIPCYLMSPITFLKRPLRWLEAIGRFKASISHAPNFAFDYCVDRIPPEQRTQLDLSTWKQAANAAEPVRAKTLSRFVEAFGPQGFRREAFCPSYGLAEHTVLVTSDNPELKPTMLEVSKKSLQQDRIELATPAGDSQTLVACGRPTEGVDVVIVHPSEHSLHKKGEVGEIWLASTSVAQGYWKRPEETHVSYEGYLKDNGKGPYLRTGDLGFLFENQLYITGRIKELIIMAGRNYYPHDIEETVSSAHQELGSNVAAFAVELQDAERLIVVAEVKRKGEKNKDVAAIGNAVSQQIWQEHNLLLHELILIKPGSLTKTSSGKVQHAASRQAYLKDTLEVVARWQWQTQQPDTQQTLPDQGQCLRSEIHAWMGRNLAVDPRTIDDQRAWATYGMNSAKAVQMAADLEDHLGRELEATILWRYPNVATLVAHLANNHSSEPVTRPEPRAEGKEPIAIIGMGCRFPGGATDPETYWQHLCQVQDAVTEVPPERWDVEAWYDPNPEQQGKTYTRQAAFLKTIDAFDAHFFNISPREAAQMDPQQRLLLEVTWEALEHGGIDPTTLRGSRTGVFVGQSSDDFANLNKNPAEENQAHQQTGSARAFAAGRIAYCLDLQGPAINVDTTCSSSLVAITQAARALQCGEIDSALAGGVSLMLDPQTTVGLSRLKALAADGRCKPFASSADGYGRGEGSGMVVLKRQSEAHRDGDTVLAAIQGWAVNHDGASNGMTAPNGAAQEALLRQAWTAAAVRPEQIHYVETHGTGTSLGDPIEAHSLAAVRGKTKTPLYLGSVKAHIGHLEAAAGVAGLIKLVLCLSKGKIPAQRHHGEPSRHIPWTQMSLQLVTETRPWPTEASRLAGVSSFGMSGTNVHLVVSAEPPAALLDTNEQDKQLLVFSAKTKEALHELAQQHRQRLTQTTPPNLASYCATAAKGRASFRHRVAISGTNGEIVRALKANHSGEPQANLHSGTQTGKDPKLAYVFTGQGSQYAGMGMELYGTNPVFRQELERCARILEPQLDRPLLELLRTGEGLEETQNAQPALFALEYGLASMWQAWGMKPAVVMGHSLGEYVAACVAGVYSLEAGLALVVKRGQLMATLPEGGSMAAVFAEEAHVAEVLKPYSTEVVVAAINGPERQVLSGPRNRLAQVLTELEQQGHETRWLNVEQAYHAPAIEPILDEFEAFAASMTYGPPKIPLISNVTGKQVEHVDAGYWRKHSRKPTLFEQGLATLQEQEVNICLEIGPKPVLSNLARHNPNQTQVWMSSLETGRTAKETHNETLGTAYVAGLQPNWQAIYPEAIPRHTGVPHYPYQRQSYPIPKRAAPQTSKATKQAREQTAHTHSLNWKTTKLKATAKPHKGTWMILGEGELDFDSVPATMARLVFVHAKHEQNQHGKAAYSYEPTKKEAMATLLDRVRREEGPLQGVILVHAPRANQHVEVPARALRLSTRLLKLVQALEGYQTPPRLVLVTRGAQAVGSTTTLPNPGAATFWGMARVIAIEHPELKCIRIDLDPQVPDGEALDFIKEITTEQRAELSEDQIAYRAGTRYVLRLSNTQPAARSQPHRPRIRGNASYLITGGLGGLGMKVAHWLVAQGARTLILASRQAEQQELPSQWASMGVTVQAVKTDVTEEQDIIALIARIRKEMPPLKGLFHLAGQVQDAIMQQQDKASLRTVLGPKVDGAWNLHQHTDGMELDFFVLFSSAAAVLGSPGQANYAAANAFLDALAWHRNGLGLPATSINWGPWQDVGMETALKQPESPMRPKPIPQTLGLELLAKAIDYQPSQVLYVPWPPPRMLSVLEQAPILRGFHYKKAADHQEPTHPANEKSQERDAMGKGDLERIIEMQVQFMEREAAAQRTTHERMITQQLAAYQAKETGAPRQPAKTITTSTTTMEQRSQAPIQEANSQQHGFWNRRKAKQASETDEGYAPQKTSGIEFGLYYFGKYDLEDQANTYNLQIESARYADREGFTSLWVPERHFHPLGGFSPNPGVLCAALARETERIRLNGGSVVAPLHHPVRIAEDWSLVDNLSKGRVGIAFASGWHPNDFVLAPEVFGKHRQKMFEDIETVHKLWRGEPVTMTNGSGKQVPIQIYPRPRQASPPTWLTIVNNPETFREAGRLGMGVLTNLMNQSKEELATNLEIYRAARQEQGLEPDSGHVVVLLHTFIGADEEAAREKARLPFYEYLSTSLNLFKKLVESEELGTDPEALDKEDREYLMEKAYQRYYNTRALIGTPETSAPIVESLIAMGVKEVACFVDFGIDAQTVLEHLPYLNRLRERFIRAQDTEYQAPQPIIEPAIKPSPTEKTQARKPAQDTPIREQLQAAPASEHAHLMGRYLREVIAHTTHMEPQQISEEQDLHQLGFDSLMTMELKSRVQTELGIRLSLAKLMESSDLASLNTQLVALHNQNHEEEASLLKEQTPATAEILSDDEMSALSEDKVNTLLQEMLANEGAFHEASK